MKHTLSKPNVILDATILLLQVTKKFTRFKDFSNTKYIGNINGTVLQSRLEESAFCSQSVRRNMKIRLGKPAVSNFSAYGWQK